MEALEILCIVAFSLCGVGLGVYGYIRRRRVPTMKQSPSSDNLVCVVEDPQSNDLTIGAEK